MAHAINRKCSSCEKCVTLCPTGSIYYGVFHFVINADSCHDCKVCVSICPDDAILPLDDKPVAPVGQESVDKRALPKK
jgi:ferredoxin